MATAEKGNIPGKKMVCLSRWGDQGKSETIKALFRLLVPNEKEAKNLKWHRPKFPQGISYEEILREIEKPNLDICVVKTVNGKCVGLNSGGDYPDDVKQHLKALAEENCDIIFCTSRSKGYTVEEVKKAAKKYGYKLIWTAPYSDDTPPAKKPTPFQQELNRQKAKHLADFI